MKILYTGGTFDLFHYGHVNFLQKCSQICDKLVVSLNTDEFINEFKGASSILTYDERERGLNSCPYVDEVVPNVGGKDSKRSILLVKPQIIAIGDDWAHKDYYSQMSFTQEWLDEHEIVLVYVPYTKGISTTEIKARVRG